MASIPGLFLLDQPQVGLAFPPSKSGPAHHASSTFDPSALQSTTSPDEVLHMIAMTILRQYEAVDIITPETKGQMTRDGTPWPTKTVLKTATPSYHVDHSRAINNNTRTPFYTILFLSGNLSLTKNTTSILRTSKSFHRICAPILYETYKFMTESSESFRVKFLLLIGSANAASICRLRMSIPFTIRTEPSKSIGKYTRMLSQDLPGLQELEITTQFGRFHHPQTYGMHNTRVESHQALMWFASWLTRDRPSLKYAVWREENTVKGNVLGDHLDRWDDRPDVRLTITITAERPEGIRVVERVSGIQARNALRPRDSLGRIEGEEIVEPACGILLDSYKIRHKGWKALGNKEACRPFDYQLPAEASSSEAGKPATFPDLVTEYEERYFHKKLLDFGKCVSSDTRQGPVKDILFLAAMAANQIYIQEEEPIFRGPPELRTRHLALMTWWPDYANRIRRT